MNAAGPSPLTQSCFDFDAVITPRGDGSYTVRPGKMRVHSSMLTIKEVMAMARLQKSQARQLALELGAQQRRPRCRLLVSREAVERHLARRA